MANILVVCYSRTGTTRLVADDIVAATGATLEVITEPRSRTSFLDYLRSGGEALFKTKVPIDPPRHDPAAFDLVVLGCPVWAGHIPSPMLRYVTDNHRHFRAVAFFATQLSASADKMFGQMSAVTGLQPMATMALLQDDVVECRYQGSIAQFVGQLKVTSLAA